jgi:hypothetical protein
MASYIRAVREQNAIKFSACLTKRFHGAYSPYALIELNLALTQKIPRKKQLTLLSL